MAVAGEQPQEKYHHRRHVHDGVEPIGGLDEEGVLQGPPLDAELTGQVQGLLDTPDPAPTVEGAVDLHERQPPGDLPHRVETEDQRALTGERMGHHRPPIGPISGRSGHHDQSGGDGDGRLPLQPHRKQPTSRDRHPGPERTRRPGPG